MWTWAKDVNIGSIDLMISIERCFMPYRQYLSHITTIRENYKLDHFIHLSAHVQIKSFKCNLYILFKLISHEFIWIEHIIWCISIIWLIFSNFFKIYFALLHGFWQEHWSVHLHSFQQKVILIVSHTFYMYGTRPLSTRILFNDTPLNRFLFKRKGYSVLILHWLQCEC